MPELPEVEAIRRAVDRQLGGRVLRRLEIRHPDVWAPDPRTPDPAVLDGRTLTEVHRRGKYLIFGFAPDYRLIIHLRMTGQLRLRPHAAPVADHTHAQFDFGEAGRMDFRDVRRFGRIELSPEDSDWGSRASIRRLGPEPTAETLSVAHLRRAAARHGRLVLKAFLLDQSVIAGLGNIYADEIAFTAGIHPARPIRMLRPRDWEGVYGAILGVVDTAVRLGGTSFSDYIHLDGSRGGYQDVARVYTRAGRPCRTCHTPLIKTRVATRGTVYCPVCQPPPRGFRP